MTLPFEAPWNPVWRTEKEALAIIDTMREWSKRGLSDRQISERIRLFWIKSREEQRNAVKAAREKHREKRKPEWD